MIRNIVHFTHKDNAERILESGFINNTTADDLYKNFSYWRLFYHSKGKILPIAGFVYDIEKSMQSQYDKTAPWIDEKYIKSTLAGTNLFWFLPRYIKTYKLDLFKALMFKAEINGSNSLENTMIDVSTNEEIYVETWLKSPLKMINPEIFEATEAAEAIFWYKEPYPIYRYDPTRPYHGRTLEKNPKTFTIR